jgi:uncharacterized membrane protein YgcG
MSHLPDYIPAKAPGHTVTDLSGTLTPSQLTDLDSFGKTLSFRARILVLPKSYKASDADQLHSLAADIASAWKVEDNRFLLVVDLSGKKLRAIAGSDLHDHGVTHEYLQRTVWPNYFYPHVRSGDIAGALTDSLKAIESQQAVYTRAGQSATTSSGNDQRSVASQSASPMVVPTSPDMGGGHGTSALVMLAAFIVVVLAAIYLVVSKSNKDKSKRLSQALTERLGKLYKTADELGQACEYIAPKSNKELALKVSAFFEKLQALDKAKDEIEKLSAAKRWGKANDALMPALRLTDKLGQEADSLYEAVSAITGGVDTMKLPAGKEKPALTAESDKENNDRDEKSRRIKVDMSAPYQRPTWSYNPEYSQPIFVNQSSSGGIFDMLYLINQMETDRRIDNLERNQWAANSGGGSFFGSSTYGGNSPNFNRTDSGGDWGSSSSFSSGGDSGFSTDSGGSWGDSSSSSSDFGSSTDSGGDWS